MGDTVGHDALAMHALLCHLGFDARLFAEIVSDGLRAGSLLAARAFLDLGPCLAIYHQATSWHAGHALLAHARGQLVVRDHNVTPESFFEGVSEDLARCARDGDAQRAALARSARVDLFLPASRRSARDLVTLGAPPDRIVVVPPFHRAEDLATLDADGAMLRRFATDPADVLFVGRVAPNKGHLRLLEIARLYRRLSGEPLRMRLVGNREPSTALWLAAIKREAMRAGLGPAVEQPGALSDSELRAAWLTSRVFLCASEHEGFCVPLVEAQRFGLPIVALDEEGIAETLGGGSLLFPADDPLAAAIALQRLLADPHLREGIVATQRRRYEAAFRPEIISRAFLEALGLQT